MHFLAHFYVVAKVYRICDTVPPCRAHFHMFTIITVPEGTEGKHSYSSWRPITCLLYPRTQWARKQLLTNPSLCIQYRNTHLSGFALGIYASLLHTNLRNWSITITYVTIRYIDIHMQNRISFSIMIIIYLVLHCLTVMICSILALGNFFIVSSKLPS